ERLRISELIKIGLIFLGALHRIVERVRQHHPGGAVTAALGHVERPVWHQMEADELHVRLPERKPRIFSATTSAFSICARWPHAGMISTRAPSTRSCHRFA